VIPDQLVHPVLERRDFLFPAADRATLVPPEPLRRREYRTRWGRRRRGRRSRRHYRRTVGPASSVAAGHLVEIPAPVRRNRLRISRILLVELLEKRQIHAADVLIFFSHCHCVGPVDRPRRWDAGRVPDTESGGPSLPSNPA